MLVTVAVSRTAEYVALYRALETLEPRPRVRDPYAAAFLPPSLALAVRAARLGPLRARVARYADSRAPGARTSAIARTAAIDDACRKAGARQLVILGAGFDCRAHRLVELADCAVFEVDRAETQAAKRARLAHAGARSRDDIHYVAVDFLRDDVAARLAAAGWQREIPTVFVWEGVTHYLTERAVRQVLGWIGGSAPGSRVVFTYIHGGLLDGGVDFAGGADILGRVRALGEPWTFGVRPDALPALVADCGLRLVADDGADDYRQRYLGATNRGYAFYRLAIADVVSD